ncbi:ABC-2 transporter permease [Alkalibaculum sp. M08DMB]|uniref:ABC-2 transporter permease n=1 Tax=Alkalibaculum sporogenes TaxID=2655001 RepID=A0A6A7K5J0_9FIRM|nr:ABC-2 transporter permease [Alkalibaculum sporogenes]MPW24413.1 ABC-2 transporter permease [Alkalibaculum sporogenes]
MKGLLIKDLLAMKKQGKTIIALLFFYIIYAVTFKNVSMLGMVIVLICAMMPITTLSYDEKCKWDSFALSTTVSRKTLVLSKYIFSIILILCAIVIVALLSSLMVFFSKELEIVDALLMSAGLGGIALVFLTLTLPLLFKFGVEKGRMLMLATFLIPSMIIMLFSNFGFSLPDEQVLRHMSYVSPIIIFFLIFISIKVSIKIVHKKEF